MMAPSNDFCQGPSVFRHSSRVGTDASGGSELDGRQQGAFFDTTALATTAQASVFRPPLRHLFLRNPFRPLDNKSLVLFLDGGGVNGRFPVRGIWVRSGCTS